MLCADATIGCWCRHISHWRQRSQKHHGTYRRHRIDKYPDTLLASQTARKYCKMLLWFNHTFTGNSAFSTAIFDGRIFAALTAIVFTADFMAFAISSLKLWLSRGLGVDDDDSDYVEHYLCSSSVVTVCLQCFDAVGWLAGRASGL